MPLSDDVFRHLSGMASQGSLQALGMASRCWLDRAYSLAPEAWASVDMKEWPFAVREVRKERVAARRRAKMARRDEERRQRGEEMRQHAQGRALGSDRTDLEDLMADASSSVDWSSTFEDFDMACSGLVDDWEKIGRRNARVSDDELWSAVCRISPGQLKRLAVCSSAVTAAGVCRVLEAHGPNLVGLRLSSCGSKKLSGDRLAAALARCTQLRALELHGVSAPLPVAARELRDLLLGEGTGTQMRLVPHFRELRVLKVGRGNQGQGWFLETLEACPELRTVHVYCAVQITNEVLACMATHLRNLESLCGSRTGLTGGARTGHSVMFPFADGPRAVGRMDLEEEVVAAFRQRFPEAKIFIDDVYGEQLMEDDDW